VRTCAVGIVSHKARFESGHIGKEEVGNLHIWYGIPRVSHAAFVGLASGTSRICFEIAPDGPGNLVNLGNFEKQNRLVTWLPGRDQVCRQSRSRQRAPVTDRWMKEGCGDIPLSGLAWAKVEEIIRPANVAYANCSQVT